jgi:flagellar hook-associated protein 1
MAGIIGNGLSALLAMQRSLQTTSNNIANANTEGYVRQRVSLVEAPTQLTGVGSLGQGVLVGSIDRLYDQLLTEQFRDAATGTSRADAFSSIASRVDRLLGNPETGATISIQRFFSKVDAVSRDPTSLSNRQQLLLEGSALASRLRALDGQLQDINNDLSARLRLSVDRVNQLSTQIADLNAEIIGRGQSAGADLLDRRDALIQELAQQIDVQSVRETDGSITIYAGTGQGLVVGGRSSSLVVVPGNLDQDASSIAIQVGNQLQDISTRITGGTIGGLLAARATVVETSRLQLGQLALGLADAFNAQHRQGADFNGALGGDFFTVGQPGVAPANSNAGTASVTATFANTAALEARNYELRFTGGVWSLLDRATNAPVAMTGAGTVASPFAADGLNFVVSGSAQNGDRFLVQPFRNATASFAVALTDPSKIAAASPLTASANLGNVSNASIGAARVTNVADPKLLATGTIVFDSPTSYRVYTGTGADITGPLPYTPGADISFAGWTVQVNGTPLANDRFTIAPSPPGSGNNGNALALAGLTQKGYFRNGTQSFADLGSDIVATVGATAARAANDVNAQEIIRNQTELDLESASGVNLEEEAANLLKYQESYQAAAKVISVGDELFRTLLSILGR